MCGFLPLPTILVSRRFLIDRSTFWRVEIDGVRSLCIASSFFSSLVPSSYVSFLRDVLVGRLSPWTRCPVLPCLHVFVLLVMFFSLCFLFSLDAIGN